MTASPLSGFGDWWMYGGVWMYVVLLTLTGVWVFQGLMSLGVLGAGLAGWRGAAIGIFTLALCLSVAPLGMSGLGWMATGQEIEAAVAFADPKMAEMLRAQGYAEAASIWQLGLVATVLAALGGGVMGLGGLGFGFLFGKSAGSDDLDE